MPLSSQLWRCGAVKDGESDSYLDLADIMTSESVIPDQECEELYRCQSNASPDSKR